MPKVVKLDIVGDRISVTFPYHEDYVGRMRTVAGRRWSKSQGHWTVPADWQSATELRRAFGDELELSAALREWGRWEKARQKELASLAAPDVPNDIDLPWLAKKEPRLATAIHLGPKGLTMSPEERRRALDGPSSFQAADVRFMVESPNPLNANHMGLGKTIETIAAILEEGLDDGPILVVAPVSAAEGTWPGELENWQDGPVWLARGTNREKRDIHEEFLQWVTPIERPRFPTGQVDGNGGWLIINPAQIQLGEEVELCEKHANLSHKRQADLKIIRACSDRGDHMEEEELFFNPCCLYRIVKPFPDLFNIEWNAVIYDEAHEHGILNPKSLTGRGARALKTKKTYMLTGTPMGGKEIRLFEILQFLNPKVFTSKWRFAEQYLEIGITEFWQKGDGIAGRGPTGNARTIGGIRRCPTHQQQGRRPAKGECSECDGHEQRFFEQLGPYILRRTKDEVLPELPPKQHIDLWCPFGSTKHESQYNQFAADAEAVIEGERISATNVISEYTRLGQMAWGTATKGMAPTRDSGKLKVLEEKLAELGIFDKEGEEQVVIFSQYRQIVDLIHAWLVEKGVPAGKLHGGTNARGERAALKESFQGQGGLRALVVTTKAGGTSLTLDRASHVFIIDETWNPDNEEQAEDRCHRGSRIHQVTIYRLRTKGTIDEYKMETAWDKAARNKNVMDLRRIKLRDTD